MSEINFNGRLKRLEERRKGFDFKYSFDGLESDTKILNEFESLKESLESWQTQTTKPSIKYALGAMQEVNKRYTEISIETAGKVEKQLKNKLLSNYNISTSYELQGSVPLNIHIKGVSDVDLLVFNKIHYRSERYLDTFQSEDISVLAKLRDSSYRLLKLAYPAVDIDNTGAKCITLSGGSLQREVDVVPAHWVQTDKYRTSYQSHELGVNILDKKKPATLMNLPFKHMHLIENRCIFLTDGGLRKSIRLCKSLKADLVAEGKKIYLSSYDIASIMYHANTQNLKKGKNKPLLIVLEAQRYFDHLYRSPFDRNTLYTPDGSRPIFDSQNKVDSLTTISLALDQLVQAIKKESGYTYDSSLEFYSLAI